jgi:AraC-like DNA-binding protein
MTTEHVELTLRHARLAGIHVTTVPALQIIRSDQVQPRIHSLHRPSLCYIVQGAKEVTVGGEVFRYAGSEFLFSSVELPMTGEVTEATAKKPYLCLVLEIEPSLVFDLVSALNILDRSESRVAKQAIFVGTSDEHMTDAFLRLLRCLQSQVDAQVLAPSVIREIAYRLLRGPYGAVVRQLGIADSQTRRIAHVIERLKRDYAKPLRAKELARIAGMSVSSFHQHFKKVTTLSPLQYQKQLRLQEARRLVLGNAASAAEVGFRVGYESPSQFSREYARCFGLPPITDARRAQPR